MNFSRTQFWQKPTRWGRNQMRLTRSPMTARKSPAVQGECARHRSSLNRGLRLGCLFLSNADMIRPRALWPRGNFNVARTHFTVSLALIYFVGHTHKPNLAFFFFFCHSCTIDWVKGKNVTLKTIKKKQKHKGRGTVRVVTKTVPNDSFFNFFTPPEGKLRDNP